MAEYDDWNQEEEWAYESQREYEYDMYMLEQEAIEEMARNFIEKNRDDPYLSDLYSECCEDCEYRDVCEEIDDGKIAKWCSCSDILELVKEYVTCGD